MIDWYVNEQLVRFNERLREAEAQRRIYEALSARGPRPSLHNGAMLWLGDRLVALGQRLQARDDAMREAPAGRVYLITPASSSTSLFGGASPEERLPCEEAA